MGAISRKTNQKGFSTSEVAKLIDYPTQRIRQLVNLRLVSPSRKSDGDLEFDFQSDTQGEIHGIGLDNNNAISGGRTFRVYGTQRLGLADFDDYNQTAPAVKSYNIPVGQFYTGSVVHLFFINDHDVVNPGAESVYSKCAGCPVFPPNPPALQS